MRSKEFTAMKADSKDSSENKGRGGKRPGSGRKKKFENTQQISIDAPVEIIEAMKKAGIENKTDYIINLIARNLKVKL